MNEDTQLKINDLLERIGAIRFNDQELTDLNIKHTEYTNDGISGDSLIFKLVSYLCNQRAANMIGIYSPVKRLAAIAKQQHIAETGEAIPDKPVNVPFFCGGIL